MARKFLDIRGPVMEGGQQRHFSFAIPDLESLVDVIIMSDF